MGEKSLRDVISVIPPELYEGASSANTTPDTSAHGEHSAKNQLAAEQQQADSVTAVPSVEPAWKLTPRLLLSAIIVASCVPMTLAQVTSAEKEGKVDAQHAAFDTALACYMLGHGHRSVATVAKMARGKNWENKNVTSLNDAILIAGSGLFFANNLLNTLNAPDDSKTTPGVSLIVPLCFAGASLAGIALAQSASFREKPLSGYTPLAAAAIGAAAFGYVHPDPIVKACAGSIVAVCCAGLAIRAYDDYKKRGHTLLENISQFSCVDEEKRNDIESSRNSPARMV